MYIRIDFMSTVVTSCFILHNMCEIHKDGFNEQCRNEEVMRQSITTSGANPTQHSSHTGGIRSALTSYFETH